MEERENDAQMLLKPKRTIFGDFFVFVLWSEMRWDLCDHIRPGIIHDWGGNSVLCWGRVRTG